MRSALVTLAISALVAGCNATPALQGVRPIEPTLDAGPDAAIEDAGVAAEPDAGTPVVDAGIRPAPDAGAPVVNAGEPPVFDAGIPAAEAPELPCTDADYSVYLTPAGPPPVSDAARGDRVRCAFERTLSLAEVTAKVPAATSAVSTYRVSYRTRRGTGDWAISSARVFLPQTSRGYPLPIIVVAHPSMGVGDSCAPSKDLEATSDLALPWAAKGYAVIAPDFAGLGTEGIQGYVDARDTGQSTLDAARALRKLHTPATFDQRIGMVGYSQGGGAVLSAQSLEGTYGSGGKLTAVAAMAPQWQSRLDSFGTITLLRNPLSLTISTGYTKPVIAMMRQYGYFATHLGLAHAGDSFPAIDRTQMMNALDTLCLIPFGGWVQGTHFKLGDLVDEGFRTSTIACVDTPNDPACVEPGKSYVQFLNENMIPPDPLGAPVLYIQGLLDTVMPPLEEAACNVPRLQQAGVDLTLCTDLGASHFNLVALDGDLAQRWAEAKLSGTQPPTCTTSPLAPCPP